MSINVFINSELLIFTVVAGQSEKNVQALVRKSTCNKSAGTKNSILNVKGTFPSPIPGGNCALAFTTSAMAILVTQHGWNHSNAKYCGLIARKAERKTWCVGVSFRDVRRGELGRLPLAPDAQLLLGHLSFYSPIVLLWQSSNALYAQSLDM